MKSRATSALVCLGLLAALAPAARAADYPSRPIKLVVPYAAGGPTDVLGRLVGDFLGRDLKQPVIVENKAGAQGAIGAEAVARADPDGVIPVRPPAKIGIKARHSRDSATL